MSTDSVVNENGAAQHVPSDYSEESLIRERDSHRLRKTDPAKLATSISQAKTGTLCAEWDADEIDPRSITLRPARLAAS